MKKNIIIISILVFFLQINVFTNIVYSAEKIPQIQAEGAIVLDMKSNRVLYQKNINKKMYIASTTKIMTAIITIENGHLDEYVSISERAINTAGSTINLKKNEKIKVKELLYGLMLKSGNDAAVALAEYVGGTVENFIVMMNNKAKDIGLLETQFKTPHGLDIEGHYSTPFELACIAKYALQNPLFSKIVATENMSIKDRNFNNTNEMLSSYNGANGVKTGYTGKAGRCLVTSVIRNDLSLVSVVLNCATKTDRTISSKKILDYVFNNYKTYNIINNNDIVKNLLIIKGTKKEVSIVSCEGIVLPLTIDEKNKLEIKIDLPNNINAPIYSNIEVGGIKYLLDGKVIAQTKLKVIEKISKKQIFDYFTLFIVKWIELVNKII